MKPRRFSRPLDNTRKVSVAITPGLEVCLADISSAYGLSVAEVVRRFVAVGIVTTAPPVLGEISRRQRDEIETLAGLGQL